MKKYAIVEIDCDDSFGFDGNGIEACNSIFDSIKEAKQYVEDNPDEFDSSGGYGIVEMNLVCTTKEVKRIWEDA